MSVLSLPDGKNRDLLRFDIVRRSCQLTFSEKALERVERMQP